MVLRWIVNGLALLVVAHVVPGVHVDSLLAGFAAAAVLGIVNALVRPVAILLTLPLNVLTLGLFTFVINAMMLALTAVIVPGFRVHGVLSALGGSVVLSVISSILSHLVRG